MCISRIGVKREGGDREMGRWVGQRVRERQRQGLSGMASSLSVTVADREAATLVGWSNKDWQEEVVQSKKSATVAHWKNREGSRTHLFSSTVSSCSWWARGYCSCLIVASYTGRRWTGPLLVSKSGNQLPTVAGWKTQERRRTHLSSFSSGDRLINQLQYQTVADGVLQLVNRSKQDRQEANWHPPGQ